MSFNMVFLELCSYLPFLKTVITKIKFGLLKKGSLCILSTTLLFSLNDKHEKWKCFIVGEIWSILVSIQYWTFQKLS